MYAVNIVILVFFFFFKTKSIKVMFYPCWNTSKGQQIDKPFRPLKDIINRVLYRSKTWMIRTSILKFSIERKEKVFCRSEEIFLRNRRITYFWYSQCLQFSFCCIYTSFCILIFINCACFFMYTLHLQVSLISPT